MTDEAYCFQQTERDAKRIARGAYSKKCGKRSKKCSLPSDYMTTKERKAMNGKAESFNIGKPMDRASFKKLPDDLKREYILNLADKYEARAVDIANMLGYSKNGFWSVCNQLFAAKSPFRGKMKKEISPKWLNFINPPLNDVIEAKDDKIEKCEPVVEKAAEKREEPTPAVKAEYPELTNMRVHMNGNIVMICAQLIKMLRNDEQYSVSIEVRPYNSSEYPF